MKRKKSKFFILIFSAVLISILSLQNVYASNDYSFSVGTKYSNNTDDDSSDEATIVYNNLYDMGYKSKLLTIPTYSTLTAKNSDSTKYLLESDILYFLGHASSTTISWNYLGKGGEYAVAIRNDNSNVSDKNWTYVGMGNYNMSKVDLGVFMGCSTASNSNNNLPKYAYSQGATTTIGWTKDIPQADTSLWTRRFYGQLKNGDTVQKALDYANSFTYSNSAIKNTRLYGNEKLIIKFSIIAGINLPEKTEKLSSYTVNQKLDIAGLDSIAKQRSIGEIIRTNVNENFNIDDFIVETAENDSGIIYDYYYTVNGIKTNIGYTVFIDSKETKIMNIVDNMNNIPLKKDVNKIYLDPQNLSENRLQIMRDKATAVNDDSLISKKIIDEYKYYDIKNNKLYYNIVVESIDMIPQTKSIEYYQEEI